MKTSLFSFALLFLVISTPSHAWQEPDDFRGMKWEISSEDAENFIREQWRQRRQAGEIIVDTDISKSHMDERLKSLVFRDKIGGLPVTIGLEFLDDKFVYARIFFKSKDFRILESAFKDKYGQPMSEALIPVRTASGARYENKELKWNGQSLRIWLRQYDGKVTDGTASLGKLVYLEYLAEKDKKRRDAAAKDL